MALNAFMFCVQLYKSFNVLQKYVTKKLLFLLSTHWPTIIIFTSQQKLQNSRTHFVL